MTTVLVVDDSAVDRCLVTGLLHRALPCTVQEAENGLVALTMMKDVQPDIVLTDLQMPKMNGLELVTAILANYPETPVILMTAYGSESLAVDALKCGAVGYVPKVQLAETLPDTIQDVLALLRSNRSHQQLIKSIRGAEIQFTLENRAVLIDAAVDFIQQVLTSVGLCDNAERLRVGVAFGEALRNALYHGNLEISYKEEEEIREQLMQGKGWPLIEQRLRQHPYCSRRIFVDVRITAHEARLVVRDEGAGFDVKALPTIDDSDALQGRIGHGLVLIRTFMDEVVFNDVGNEITMIKRRRPDASAHPELSNLVGDFLGNPFHFAPRPSRPANRIGGNRSYGVSNDPARQDSTIDRRRP